MQILFLDLETTGLPQKQADNSLYPYQETQHYETSRVVQIGIQVYVSQNKTFKLLHSHNIIIKPDDFVINNNDFHSITQTIAEEKGIDFKEAVRRISHHFARASLLVTHNVKFDKNVMRSELFRHEMFEELKEFSSIPTFCTSEQCADITRIRMGRYKSYKFPKLTELHTWLFKQPPSETLHDALEDVKVLARCFFELLNRGLIQFEQVKL